MKNAGSTVQIDVDALAIGMYIHLDVGWMSHPFPLSCFRIASQDQIGTIRALGLKTVRWSPEQSALAEAQANAAREAKAVVPLPLLPAAMACDPVLQRRRDALAAERSALALCEQQFAEATRECRRLFEQVGSRPQAAPATAAGLSRALMQKMTEHRELCIRVLNEAAGDKASAHAVNVALVALLMGRNLGLEEPDLLDLGVGALLHDMGKLDLPQRVRHREDHYSAAETRSYEEHVAHGVTRARAMGLPAGATLVIAQHHEHADGSGFPLGLAGERMTPSACIVALVNRYDNLCNPPLPSRGFTPHEALSLLFAQGRQKFEPAILGAFIKMMGVYPPGSVVQLTDDRHGLVVGVNASRPLRPRVMVLDEQRPDDDAVMLDLEQTPSIAIRRSMRPQTLAPPLQERLGGRPRVAYFFEPAAREDSA